MPVTKNGSLAVTQRWLMGAFMLSHVLEGWMMSKLLSLKVAKLLLPVPAAGWAEEISRHYVDGTIPLRSQATSRSCVTFYFFLIIIIFSLTCLCLLYSLSRTRSEEWIYNWALCSSLVFFSSADSHFDCSSWKIKINKEAVTALLIASHLNLFELLKVSLFSLHWGFDCLNLNHSQVAQPDAARRWRVGGGLCRWDGSKPLIPHSSGKLSDVFLCLFHM